MVCCALTCWDERKTGRRADPQSASLLGFMAEDCASRTVSHPIPRADLIYINQHELLLCWR